MKRRTFFARVASLLVAPLLCSREIPYAVTFDGSRDFFERGNDLLTRESCSGRMYFGYVDLSVEANRRRLGGLL